MNSADISNRIMEHIIRTSPLEPHRSYLSMSKIGLCPHEQYRIYQQGDRVTYDHQRMAFLGYRFEELEKSILASAAVYRPGSERELIAPFDPRFRGHTDGETMDGDLLEIKSVNRNKFDRICSSKNADEQHYEQVQCYMRYGGYRQAMIVYVCRENLAHAVIHIARHDALGMALESRAKLILAAIDAGWPPKCQCGRCSA